MPSWDRPWLPAAAAKEEHGGHQRSPRARDYPAIALPLNTREDEDHQVEVSELERPWVTYSKVLYGRVFDAAVGDVAWAVGSARWRNWGDMTPLQQGSR